MANVIDVAEYILSKVDGIAYDKRDEQHGDITNMKLQKLLYYCQGFSLVMLGRPLFEARLEAWPHGPVFPEVYQHYKQHRARPILCTDAEAGTRLSKEEKGLIDEVFKIYGGYSAWFLRNLSHSEAPWKDAVNEGKNEITNEALLAFFPSLCEDE